MRLIMVQEEIVRWPKACNIHGECGPHQIAAVLRVHGRAREIEELYVWSIHRRFDATLPWDPGVVLARHGIESRWRFRLRGSFIESLRSALEVGWPMLMVVRSIQGTGCLHWISAWGYDEAADEFLCYDSQCETTEHPEGNVRYSPAQLLDSLPWYGTFVVEIHGAR